MQIAFRGIGEDELRLLTLLSVIGGFWHQHTAYVASKRA